MMWQSGRSTFWVWTLALVFGATACKTERDYKKGSGGRAGGAGAGASAGASAGTAGRTSMAGASGKGTGGAAGRAGGAGTSSTNDMGGKPGVLGGSGGASGAEAGEGGMGELGGAGTGGEPPVLGCGGITCAPEAECVGAGTQAVCQCPAGYTDPRGDGSLCQDIDECSDENGGCDHLTTCTNTPGSFSCGACPAGYTGDGATGCEDVNECASDNGGCDPLTECTNTAGAHVCGNCPFGYAGTGDSGCSDIDECATNNGGCDMNTACTNTPGAFTCGDCPAGYTGGGATGCADIDECATNNGGCDALVSCSNTPGSFSCGACPSGYSGTGATGCVDVNECSTNNGGCDGNAKCTNTPGNRTCACKSGYMGDGVTCTDVNECASNNGGCSANATCSNTQGGRTCACKSGYSGDGVTCNDVDECASNNGGCSSNANCTNTPGSRTCACKSGYSGDGVTCTDVNECASNNGGCDVNATCTNTPGSRTCACKTNYTGNGTSCVCASAPSATKPLAPYRGAYTGSLRAPSARKTLRPTFSFSTSTSTCGAVTYELQLDNSCSAGNLDGCSFPSPEISVKGLTSPSYTPSTDLPVSTSAPVGALYAWRVRACDATQVCSAWSSVASLHVGRVREDVNGDGYGDAIIMLDQTSLLVYYGSGAPDFTNVSATPAVASTSDRVGSFIGDIDADGYGDIALMQYYNPTSGYAPAVVFGGASLTSRSPLVLIKSAAGSSLNLGLHPAGDFNGDGFDDFLVDFKYFDPKTELQVFYGAAQPANQAALHVPCNFPGYQLSSNGVGDLNRDGYADIALSEQGTVGQTWQGRLAFFAGGSAPSTSPAADVTRATGVNTLLYPAADLDGDGYGDAVAVENGVGLTLYKGASSFGQSIWKTLANTSTTAGVGGFDINGDGYGDLHVKGTSASIYLGGASGPSSATPFPTARGADQFAGVSVSDYDGDGLPDMVGSTPSTPLWCASAGTASPTCLQLFNNGASFSTTYAFVH